MGRNSTVAAWRRGGRLGHDGLAQMIVRLSPAGRGTPAPGPNVTYDCRGPGVTVWATRGGRGGPVRPPRGLEGKKLRAPGAHSLKRSTGSELDRVEVS